MKYIYLNNLFDKTNIQTYLYLLIIFWFFLCIYVPNDIVNILKFDKIPLYYLDGYQNIFRYFLIKGSSIL